MVTDSAVMHCCRCGNSDCLLFETVAWVDNMGYEKGFYEVDYSLAMDNLPPQLTLRLFYAFPLGMMKQEAFSD